MPGCGYVCPKCNDTGMDENLRACDWCSVPKPSPKNIEISNDDWIKKVHEGPCCGDLGQNSTQN